MSRPDQLRLDDMRERCASALDIVSRGRNAYDDDEVLRLALERALEIIGEAATHVSEEAHRLYPTVRWQDITRLRIRMAHHYHRTNPDRLWAIATEDVPALMKALGPISGVENLDE